MGTPGWHDRWAASLLPPVLAAEVEVDLDARTLGDLSGHSRREVIREVAAKHDRGDGEVKAWEKSSAVERYRASRAPGSFGGLPPG